MAAALYATVVERCRLAVALVVEKIIGVDTPGAVVYSVERQIVLVAVVSVAKRFSVVPMSFLDIYASTEKKTAVESEAVALARSVDAA